MTSRFPSQQHARYVNFFGSHGLKINSGIKDETEVFHFLVFENVPEKTDLG